MKAHGLRLHPGKCKFFQESVEYLGHVIYLGGLGVQQVKVEAIAHIPRPMDVNRVHAFMGLVNYYCRYVKGFNAMAKPLNMLLKLDQEWQSGDEQERAFVELKARLIAAPTLRRPIRERPFQLHIDWSMLGLGTMLTQCDDERKEFVVAYVSHSNNVAKSCYSSYEGECLVAVLHTSSVTYLAHSLPLSLITNRSSG
jgi:hypothetical protein